MSNVYIKEKVARVIATWWQYAYRTQHKLVNWKLSYGCSTLAIILLLLLATSLYLSPIFQDTLEDHYSSQLPIERLHALLLNVGSALIGATAIVTSLVLFAMQVNVERMPHGLFRRLSGDSKLLSAFALAFFLAIGVATLSTVLNHARLAIVVLVASWAIVFVLSLFLYAYRRALVLINPLQQLDILIQTTRKELQSWARHAHRMAPLLKRKESANDTSSHLDSTHDLARTAYFWINNHWTDGAKRAIGHAMSFARRYAEHGDYEVSKAALRAIVSINAAYVESKGKTFYVDNPLFENPLAGDSFITETLEHLRQNVRSAIARRDEQQIEQTLQAMAALVQVYLGIDYSDPCASKSHAQLAAGYLAAAVKTVVPHDMADVLMEGQRLMGQCALGILSYGNPADIATRSEEIASIACTGCMKKDYRPVTMEGMKQLTNLTVALFSHTRTNDIRFAVRRVRRDVSSVAKLFLNVTDPPLSDVHSVFLGPYYSSTSEQSLRARLTKLVNELSESPSDNVDAQAIIRNLEQWADGLYQTEKELLLASIEAKSPFTFDMIHWIKGVTEILLAVSNSPACNGLVKQEIRKHASWLVATLTYIPDDQETVKFVENFQMTETLFEAAMDAKNRGCDEIANKVAQILLSWTFKGGRFQSGENILERGLYACAVLALVMGEERVAALKTAISTHILSDVAPAQEIRDRTAMDIREKAERLQTQELSVSRIDVAISRADHESLRPLLQDVANILSSDTA